MLGSRLKFSLSGSFNPVPQLVPMARAAEECGWAMFTLADHVVYQERITTPYPYNENGERPWAAHGDWPDPWVMIGALAAVTKTIVFAPSVYILPMRNPFLVAKEVSTAAVISNNRVVLGVGVGWSKDEFDLLGQDFRSRGKRCEEMIEILRRLWSGGWADYEGQHYRFEPVEMRPAPSLAIPIWSGGMSEAALRRAARVADGWIGPNQSTAQILACLRKLEGYRKEYGRHDVSFSISVGPTDASTLEDYRRLEEAGVTHVRVRPWLAGEEISHRAEKNPAASLEGKLAAIRQFSEQVIARM